MALLNLVTTYFAPILAVCFGGLILLFVAYINWGKGMKSRGVSWISSRIYNNKPGSEQLADGLFMTFSSFLLCLGGVIVIVSLLFFQ